MESTALGDGCVITPQGIEDGPGIKLVVSSIDNQRDFKTYMQNYAVSHAPTGPRRQGPWEEGFVSSVSVSVQGRMAPDTYLWIE
jgi:hypothetical protein